VKFDPSLSCTTYTINLPPSVRPGSGKKDGVGVNAPAPPICATQPRAIPEVLFGAMYLVTLKPQFHVREGRSHT